MITLNHTLIKINSASLCGKLSVEIRAAYNIDGALTEITERATGRKFTFSLTASGKAAHGDFEIDSPLLWNVSSPELYDYVICLWGEKTEKASGSFGFRTIERGEKEILLNGKPLYIRGFIRGAKAHDHANNCNLSEEEFYRKNISEAKKFGFNFVRFHSAIPPEKYFKVADELGMLVHIEMRMPNDIYDNLKEMTNTGTMLVSDEYIEEIIGELYEHPSLAVYCVGNEIKTAPEKRIGEIKAIIDKEDGTRLFLDTCAWGANGRPYVDMDVQHMSYYFPFSAHSAMYEDTENLLVVATDENKPLKSDGQNSFVTRELFFGVPLIAHEVCHYTALRDFAALREKFSSYGVTAPWWIGKELKMIKAKGFEDIYPEMYRASKYFQAECWKTAFEAMRASPLLGGFHFLQFADTDVYENSNGVVDCFDDENYVTPEKFRQFNGDRVILAKLKSRIFSSGEDIKIKISLSNCGLDSVKFADMYYELKFVGGEKYAEGKLVSVDVSRKGLYGIGAIHVSLPKVDTSAEMTLFVKLVSGEEIYSHNSWNIWVYNTDGALSYKKFTSYENGGGFITDDGEKALKMLSEGKKVCLIYREDFTRHVRDKQISAPRLAFKASWNRFKPVIWDRGTNFGGLNDNELLNKFGFNCGRYYDFDLGTLTEDCDKIILDDFPVKPRNIMSGIDKSSRDRFDASKECFALPELMYDRTLRDFSYMFELCVGKGKLLVVGLNMTGLDRREPSTVAMSKFIINYISSEDFAPTANISLKELEEYMKKCAEAPVKERMMTQFWQLDDAPVESKAFWKESREYLSEK
ncbi:MAG: hypothetical protein IJ706_00540 [Clostridia bacterium]|nr:hypothetical protein [Clostridia bacterium]MBR1675788.1 hypothetical protein [Clostridia bacterium]